MMAALLHAIGGPVSVRRERHQSDRAGAGAVLLYMSDLHLHRDSRARAETLVDLASAERPDAILLGGDLVDSPRAHELLLALVSDLSQVASVLAVPGNHDHFWGEAKVQEAVVRGGGIWVRSRMIRIPTRGGGIAVSGDPRLLAPVDDATRVLLGHDPALLDDDGSQSADLALAGHLHGGQIVLAHHGERLYPGALFYKYCGLRFTRGPTTMLVSRGVADTLPLRFRCPREILRVEIAA